MDQAWPLNAPERRTFRCPKVDPFPLTGVLDRAPWTSIPWSEEFVDILGEAAPRPRFRTRMKMAWSDEGLLIGAEMEEPHVWGTLTEHDSVIFHDNDFEVFLDPDGDRQNYIELELNALNTTWDLLLPRSYWDGGPAVDSFEIKGLQTKVAVKGTLNDPRDQDEGWTVEILLPWRSLREVSGVPCPPQPGQEWRINFSRVQWRHEVKEGKYRKPEGIKEDNWVWSPQGVVDMHRPEMWGVLEFCHSLSDPPAPRRDWKEVNEVMAVYWAQKQRLQKEPSAGASLKALGLEQLEGRVALRASGAWFEAESASWIINATGRLVRK